VNPQSTLAPQEKGWGADWQSYGADWVGVSYYDAESITRPSKDVVRVWDKLIYTEKGLTDMVARLGERNRTLSDNGI
jgi:hypothetical protein